MNKFVKKILVLNICSALFAGSAQAATYEITEINTINSHDNTFFIDENLTGQSVLLATGVKNFTVQYDYFSDSDLDAIIQLAEIQHERVFGVDNIEDPDAFKEAMKLGTPSDNDYLWVLRYIQAQKGLFSSQQYGESTVLLKASDELSEIVVFDVPFEGTDTLTRSTTDTVAGINNRGWVFGTGTAPYLPVEFTNGKGTEDTSDDEIDNYWLREFQSRAFYTVDQGDTIVEVVPPETTYGGISAITDMTDSGIAIGYASTSISQRATNLINQTTNNCSDDEINSELPEAVCIDNALRRSASQLYTIQPIKWQIDDSGNLISEEILNHLITPHPEDTRALNTFAQATNDLGTVVGYADGWFKENITNPKETQSRGYKYAVVFKDDRVVELYPERKDHLGSRANDINNNEIIVGSVYNGAINQFYYVDATDIDNMEVVFPDTFFSQSSSQGKSINDKGFVVGNAVAEHGSDRTHAFLFDTNNNLFSDLNDFLPCDSKYTIVDASEINENNEILATAIIEVNVQDSDGNNILDDNGDPILDQVAVGVKLNPIDGEIETCSDDGEPDKVERQGASVGYWALLLLSILGLGRIRNKK